ncbi:TPA: diacylglycerol kinase family protein [Legionella pneumophila]|nr:diacylglycerol kinase family protein [Legionella pneumophila]HCJ1101044.1 diacylglycerol kinase family lipid kinase [Legionella pneumophila]HCJ1110270.1 diacylglycerol kinase family lipid kinase [Legionella pneumophila]HCJ1113544.1 diacylglycerol kinase family lipid kinase [Legionella pneumophila]HCU6011741.1 diacylglycerol kinase family lipid kinase [Legionella pneumophila]
MSKIAVVINPIAGGGRGKKIWKVLKPGLHALFEQTVYRISNRVNDLEAITDGLLAENPDSLLIIGGDGTSNHVLNGLIENDKLKIPQTKIAFFNAGCGGDFTRQFPQQKITEFLDRISHNQFIKCDIGKITLANQVSRYFINIASCGLSGHVVLRVSKSKWLKKLGGTLNYLLHALIGLMTYRKTKVRVQIDDALPSDSPILLMAVCSGQYFGGGMHVAPMAKVNDGLFDVVSFNEFSKLNALLKLYKIYSGEHLLDNNVHYVQAKKIKIEPLEESKIEIEADGEIIGCLPAQFEFIKETLPLIV